jgi:hypothetical protein
MLRRLTSFISAVIVLACAPAASAQDIWSAVGATGIVDELDTSIYVFGSNGAVAIKSAVASGTLNLRYPVQTLPDLLVPQPADCPDMRVNLRDTGPGARVIVRFMALMIFPGSPNELTTLGVIDSNSRPPDADPNAYRAYRTCLTTLPDGEFLIDRAFFTYFVDVELTKTNASAHPGLLSVQICPAADRCDP